MIVWNGDKGIKHLRVFVKYADDGRALTRIFDLTSASEGVSWDNCVPYDRTLFGFEAVEDETLTDYLKPFCVKT